ncbi:hypothetical protein [Streptomyces canus]|uniref:hypothetical protein n=1 Tax=Streptomyces canus TaxID=58343 RepID=UPI002F90EF4D
MSTKKRAAVAAALSSTAGGIAGLAASHYGLDPQHSAQFGAVVSGAVGNLLYQAFRLTPGENDRSPKDTDAIETDVDESDGVVSDIANAPGTGLDTADTDAVTPPPSTASPGSGDTPAASDTAASDGGAEAPRIKHPRHRKLARAAQRRIERCRHNGRKENGHGAA